MVTDSPERQVDHARTVVVGGHRVGWQARLHHVLPGGRKEDLKLPGYSFARGDSLDQEIGQIGRLRRRLRCRPAKRDGKSTAP